MQNLDNIVWNNCYKINNINSLRQALIRHCSIPSAAIEGAIRKFVNIYSEKEEYESLWLDLDTKNIFSTDATRESYDSKSAYFLTPREKWIIGNGLDIGFVKRHFFNYFDNNIVCNNEMFYSNKEKLKEVRGAKLLIVAAGPTASEYDWDPKDYDHVFSCNHFYLNKKLKEHNVTLSTFAGEIDFHKKNKDDKIFKYLDNNDTLVCIDDQHNNILQEKKEDFKILTERYPTRAMFLHTRYRGKIGSAPRLIALAVDLQPREIHFIGFDGMSKSTKRGDLHNHAFQKDKRYSQKSLDYNMFRRQYVAFWDYILNDLQAHKKIKFQNLGEGHPFNMTTDISRQAFPLEK